MDEYLSGWLFSSVYVETYVRMSYVIAELFIVQAAVAAVLSSSFLVILIILTVLLICLIVF